MRQRVHLILAGCGLALISVTAPPVTRAADQGEVEQELTKLERGWCNAAVQGDAATVGAILADDYTEVSLTGQIAGKAETLSDIKTAKTTVCNIETMQIRVYGDAAVIVGRVTSQSAAGHALFRYTDIYIRRDGRWKCVAAQNTAIKSTP